jgi:hypothetical protein
VVTQTFYYIIENGLEYSYITTKEAFVFLYVSKHNPATLYYHMTVPGNKVDNKEVGFVYLRTAVSQVLSLCLIAFQSEQRF